MLSVRERKYRMNGRVMSRRAFLRAKRAQSRRLLAAVEEFRNGCAYLPDAEHFSGGELLAAVEAWVKGPCRGAWRRA